MILPAEALKRVLTAEYEANQIKLIVLNKSNESIEAIKAAGNESRKKTLARAQAEIAELTKATDKKAMEAAAELANSTANRLATMKARAEKRLDTVAGRIYERIVNI